MNANDFYNAIGVIGGCLILLGFYRISIGRWTNRSFWYELDNLAGALLMAVYQVHKHTYISVVLNIVWAIVAFRGLSSFAERYLSFHRAKKVVLDTKHLVQETVEDIIEDR